MDPQHTSPKAIARDGVTYQQIEFAIWLAQSPTLVRACQLAGVPEQTARRWVTEEPFAAEFARVTQIAESMAMAHLKAGVGDAVGFVRETVQNTEEPTETRLKAAKMILDAVLGSVDKAAGYQEKIANPLIDLFTDQAVRPPSARPA